MNSKYHYLWLKIKGFTILLQTIYRVHLRDYNFYYLLAGS